MEVGTIIFFVSDLSLIAENARAVRKPTKLALTKKIKSFAIYKLPKSNLASDCANKALEEAAKLLIKSGHKVEELSLPKTFENLYEKGYVDSFRHRKILDLFLLD